MVAQKRVGMQAVGTEPTAAQHKHIDKAVIVVVGLIDIEATDDTSQTGFARIFGETAVALVVEIAQRVAQAPR